MRFVVSFLIFNASKVLSRRRKNKMGLECHIRQVIEDEPVSGLHFGHYFWFENGLTCKDANTAEKVVELLFESGQFGFPTHYSQPNGEVKIIFEPMLRRVEDVV